MENLLEGLDYSDEAKSIIRKERLLPAGLIHRLHSAFPQYSSLLKQPPIMFAGKDKYIGPDGFLEIVSILERNGVKIGDLKERELFTKVYRFMATKHILNMIDWKNYAGDPLFHLVFPQPGMLRPSVVGAYLKANTDEERLRVVCEYIKETNPHDGKQLLNKPFFRNDSGEVEIIDGSQHKYPQCQLIFDINTQHCFSFCTYCFRHAQVRGDQDMFCQKDIGQIHRYLRQHPEVTDILITGGDAGFLTADRFAEYVEPIIQDHSLLHIRTVRLGTRVLTYHPEFILTRDYGRMLALFRKLKDNGVQLLFMSHFSTPREILNPATVAGIRRLQAYGAVVKSQSPIMRNISLFTDEKGKVDVDRSAQNWIDLGNLLAMLSVGFHSMYCARPTGEHHYFTAPLADINRIFSKAFRSLASINRPSRYITMTFSSGKISLLGTADVNGKTLFALKFNEARNMEWMDKVFLAEYDETENTIERLKPYGADKFFYQDELAEIERKLEASFAQACGASSRVVSVWDSQIYDQ